MLRFALPLIFSFLSFQSAWASPSGLIYRPTPFNSARAKLLVVIHGCLQSAESMAFGTGFAEIAAKNNWVVYFPQVDRGSHPLDCWGWYKPENQKSTQGQLKRLSDEIHDLKRELRMGTAPTYLAGISSGGATVSGLIACFPDSFAGAAIHSGTSYGLARNLTDAESVLKEGPQDFQAKFCHPGDFKGRLLVLQGHDDKVLNPKHAERIMTDFLPNAKALPAGVGLENGNTYQLTEYFENYRRRGRLVMIQDFGHAWSGYEDNLRHSGFLKSMTQVPFFSSQGPNATRMMWNFFTTK